MSSAGRLNVGPESGAYDAPPTSGLHCESVCSKSYDESEDVYLHDVPRPERDPGLMHVDN